MTEQGEKRIGIMGGTFDPIHNAHIALGECALRELMLDEIWFMPAGNPYFKKKRNVTSGEIRCRMTELALQEKDRMIMSDFEQHWQGETYTADTVTRLQEIYPFARFFFILGSDSLYQIEHWYHPERIMKLAALAVADREYADRPRSLREQAEYLMEKYQADIKVLPFPEMDLSSTELRDMVRRGESIAAYVPVEVNRYIIEHGLYKEPEEQA